MFGEFTQTAMIAGQFQRDYILKLEWLPHYIDNFPEAMSRVDIKWNSCKFHPDCKLQVPKSHGVYCFTTYLTPPLLDTIQVPLYIGKAATQLLSERFDDYFRERGNPNGRQKLVYMLNRYRDKLTFWWAPLPRVHVEIVEEHLLMCCFPPCNDKMPPRDRLWGKAFEIIGE